MLVACHRTKTITLNMAPVTSWLKFKINKNVNQSVKNLTDQCEFSGDINLHNEIRNHSLEVHTEVSLACQWVNITGEWVDRSLEFVWCQYRFLWNRGEARRAKRKLFLSRDQKILTSTEPVHVGHLERVYALWTGRKNIYEEKSE